MVRVVAHGETSNELDILRYLSSPEVNSLPGNHTIPVLGELSYEDWKFAIFPLVGARPCEPWFHNVGEALDRITQTLEGLTFLHDHLIAHRDIGESNILINHTGSRPRGMSPIFRSRFPVRYYFIDYEYSIRFASDSDPATRLVSRIEEIARFGAPEIQTASSYCPFTADVFSLGFFYFDNFRQLDGCLSSVVQIFRDMLISDPTKRITAKTALASLRALCSSLSVDILQLPVPPRVICLDDSKGVETFLWDTRSS